MDLLSNVNNIQTEVFSSSSNVITDIFAMWPQILIATGVIFIGWLLMFFTQFIIKKIAYKASLHSFSERIGLTSMLQKAQIKSSPSKVLGNFLGGYIFTLFFLAASNILGLTPISEFLDTVIQYIPHVIVALFIVLIGFQIATTTGAIVESTLNILESSAAKILGIVAKSVIILFSILGALIQLNIAEKLVTILFTGVVSMLALAGGLAIGLGSKDFVKEILQEMKKHHKDPEPKKTKLTN